MLLAAALVVEQAAQPALARQMTREEVESCQTRDEAQLRTAVEAITQTSLKTGLARFDYRSVVAAEWRKGGLDDLIDRQVDIAVAAVRDETSKSEQLRTLIDKEKAQAMALQVAERVYRSDAMKAAIETLTAGVAREVGQTIVLSTGEAAEPALQCLETYLGPRFGVTVARAVAADAQREFRIDPARTAARISTGSVVAENSEALAGAVILVVRRQLANIATRVSQRVVGSILGRLVSVVAGGIGLVLIAKDIWDYWTGVLPIIATEMKSKATKAMVQDELVKAISEQIGEHTREIAAATADRVLDIWREFQRGHAKVLDLADRNAGFRTFTDRLKAQDLPRLNEVVAIVLASEGEAGATRRLADGTLERAVTRLPAPAMEIARDRQSIEHALAWTALAGAALPKIVEHGLHKRSDPQDFTAAQLARLLALEDRTVIGRIAGLSRTSREILYGLPDASLKRMASAIPEAELDTLARYLSELEPKARQKLLESVSAAPARMLALGSPRVRDAVLSSQDQLAAIELMLRSDSGLDLARIREDLALVYGGRVSPILIWDKHPAVIVATAGAAFLLLLILRRLVAGRRRPRPA